MVTLVYLFVATVCIFILSKRFNASRSNPQRLPLPPGPDPDPIIGHARHIPTGTSWVTFYEWKKIYGDIIYLSALGQDIIVLNSYEASRDLINKKSALYVDRPKLWMVGELMGMWRLTFLTPYSNEWKISRKLIHPIMHKSAIHRYWPDQEIAAKAYLQTLLDSPKDFHENLTFFGGKLIASTVYGIQINSADDEYITTVKGAVKQIAHMATPGAALVEFIPLLRYVPSWFPGAQFKRNAEEWKKLCIKMVEYPFNHVKADLAAGVAPPSFTSTLLQEGGASEDDIMWASGSMYGAAAETTTATLAGFILAMVMYPGVQKKAQQEIDRVVGHDRLPSFNDRKDLPYLECILKETLRWQPATPLGGLRRLMEDDYYQGYHLPAGAAVLQNVWAISRDETMYKDPERFWPERFEDSDILDPSAYAFGFGRRICAGQHFADASLYIVMAYVLATFNISKARDENGKEIEPEMNFSVGLSRQLDPFECNIRPRSPHAASLIHTNC